MIEKNLEQMNLFERIATVLIGADMIRIDHSELYPQAYDITFFKTLDEKIGSTRTMLEIVNRFDGGSIGYRCPICQESHIINHINMRYVTNRDIEDKWTNCDGVEIDPTLPCVCYNCFDEMGGDSDDWRQEDDDPVWNMGMRVDEEWNDEAIWEDEDGEEEVEGDEE
jgi:hypothetical protein